MVLSCERVILKFLQRISGIATVTRKFVEAVAGTKARILDTRKTAPGSAPVDKYAVRCGGGQNHRLDLSDGVLIKSNHIVLAGGIPQALESAHRNRRGSQPIEVEVRSMDELEQALAAGAEGILLDNMSPGDVGAQWSAVLVLTPKSPDVTSRWNAPEEFAWKMFALTPKLASTLSRWACSPTRPRLPT